MTKKEIIRYVVVLVIGIVAGIYVISAIRPPVDMTPYDQHVKSLETLIDTNNAKYNRLEGKVTYWEDHAKKQDTIIDKQQTKIEKLTKDVTKRIKAVDNLTKDELYNSIINRYK
jgi:uncharacterized protein YPO0396